MSFNFFNHASHGGQPGACSTSAEVRARGVSEELAKNGSERVSMLRYTGSGYRRSDEEIRGIIQAKISYRQELAKKRSLERRRIDKMRTCLMKDARNYVHPDPFEAHCSCNDFTVKMKPHPRRNNAERRAKHEEVLQANLRVKAAKKSRKKYRQIVRDLGEISLEARINKRDINIRDVVADENRYVSLLNPILTPEEAEYLSTHGFVEKMVGEHVIWYRKSYIDAHPEFDVSNMKISQHLYVTIGRMFGEHMKSEFTEFIVNTICMMYLLWGEKSTIRRAAILELYMSAQHVDWKDRAVNIAIASLINVLANSFAVEKEVVTESLADRIDELSRMMKSVTTSTAACAIRDFFITVAALKLLPKEQALNIYKYFGKPSKTDMLSLVTMLTSAIASIVRVAEGIWQGLPLSEILFKSDPLNEAIREARYLMSIRECLYTGLPVEGYTDQNEFVRRGLLVLPILQQAMKKMNPYASDYKIVADTFNMLNPVISTVRNRVLASSRVPPFCIVMHGDPGIGKSTLMNFVYRVLSNVKKRKFTDSQVYSRILGSDFWEGYDPWSHPFIHYSELGNLHKNLAKMKGDSRIDELTSVIDSVPMPLNMAFEGKGKIYFRGELVMIDTNNPDMNLDVLFSNPAAFRRRFLYVKPHVLAKFRKPDGVGIRYDPDDEVTRLNDKYSFDVYTQVEQGNIHSKVNMLLDGNNPENGIDALYDTLFKFFSDRIAIEDALLKKKSADVDVAYGNEYKHMSVDSYEEYVKEQDFKRFEQFYESKEIHTESLDIKENGSKFSSFVYNLAPKVRDACLGKTKQVVFSSLHSFATRQLQQQIRNFTPHMSIFLMFLSWLIFGSFLIPILTGLSTFTIMQASSADLALTIVDKLKDDGKSEYDFAVEDIKDYVNCKRQNLFVRPTHLGKWIIAGAGVTLILGILYQYFKRSDKETESFTDFLNPSQHNETLNTFEQAFGVKNAVKRFAGAQNETWVVKTIKEPIVHTGGAVVLSKSIASNVKYACVIQDDGLETFTCVMGICEDYALINTHAIPKGNFKIRVSMTYMREGHNHFKDSFIDASTRADVGNDITILRLGQMQFKNVLKHINEVDFENAAGAINCDPITLRKMRQPLQAKNKRHGMLTFDNVLMYEWKNHSVGMCGIPVVMQSNSGSAIVAIHCAGQTNGDLGFAVRLNKTKVLQALEDLKSGQVLMPILSQSDDTSSYADPHPKSTFRHENLHNVEYLGSDGSVVSAGAKSKIVKSKIANDVKELLEDIGIQAQTQFAPPLMWHKTTASGEWVSPFNVNHKKINVQRKALDRSALSRCVDFYVDHIVTKLKEKGVHELHPYSFKDAVNGNFEDAFLRRINPATGAGYGWTGKKSQHLPVVYEDEKEVIREPTDELKKRIIDKMQDFQEGHTSGSIFGAKLKDEPREISKVLKGKTRMFYPSPVDLLILARQVLIPFFTAMVEHGEVFDSSVGVNMFQDGEKLFKEFENFADTEECIVDGDYEGFDTGMPYEIGHAAVTVIFKVCMRMGYTPEALVNLQGVLTDHLFPILEILGDILVAAGIMVSGGYGTAELNCIRNALMFMYYFETHPNLKLQDYFDYFKKKYYGDDVTGVVKKEIQKSFNNILYAKFCREIYGMNFTDPFKNDVERELKPLNELYFLKRTFVKHPELGKIFAILETDSICKMLHWTLPSDKVSEIDQQVSTVNSALWELFMRLPRADFEYFRREVTTIVNLNYGVALDPSCYVSWSRICRTLCPEAIALKEEEEHLEGREENNVVIDLDHYERPGVIAQ